MKAVAGALALNTAIALVLTALFYAQGYGHGGWGVFGRWFVMNLIISHSIGSLCQVILGRVIPLFWHRTRLRWPLLISVLLLLGFAGCVAAVAFISYVFSPARPLPFWRTVFEIFEPAAIVTVIVGMAAATLGAYRHRIEEANALLRVKDLETSARAPGLDRVSHSAALPVQRAQLDLVAHPGRSRAGRAYGGATRIAPAIVARYAGSAFDSASPGNQDGRGLPGDPTRTLR